MKIGFIGLGNVGSKLAGSLIRNNFDVTVREIDQSLTNEFKKLGAKVAKSPKELAEKTDLIITSLPSPEISAKVMESEDGILNGLTTSLLLRRWKGGLNRHLFYIHLSLLYRDFLCRHALIAYDSLTATAW